MCLFIADMVPIELINLFVCLFFIFLFIHLSTYTDAYRYGIGSSESLSAVSNLWRTSNRQVQSADRCDTATTTHILHSTTRVHCHEKTTTEPECYNQVG